MQAFWRDGYHGTSLMALSKASRIGQQSLNNAFGNKRAIYLAALKHYEAMAIETAASALRASGDAGTRIRDFLSIPLVQGDLPPGCFLCVASSEQALHDDATRALVRNGFATMERALVRALSESVEYGSESDAVRQGKARALLSVYVGLQTMARAGLPRADLQAARDGAWPHG